ncbi:MAG: DsbE family thiol:disulfide interchange protein [Gammaproteobacteria bacterium]|nr:DsbE family thiol:disulfide interchange protein [Gammaproteobacteria bacterium]
MKAKHLIPLAAFACLMVLLIFGLFNAKNVTIVPSALIGKPVPEFSLATVVDENKTLSSSDLKGKAYLLNVWASWCAACRDEHPLFMEIAKSGAIPIYGLNTKDVPQDGDPAGQDKRFNAKRFLTILGNPYVASGYDENGRVGTDFGVYGAPETFVIDKAGIIRHRHVGPITGDVWVKDFAPLIEEIQG